MVQAVAVLSTLAMVVAEVVVLMRMALVAAGVVSVSAPLFFFIRLAQALCSVDSERSSHDRTILAPSESVNVISLVSSCVGLRGEESQTSLPRILHGRLI